MLVTSVEGLLGSTLEIVPTTLSEPEFLPILELELLHILQYPLGYLVEISQGTTQVITQEI